MLDCLELSLKIVFIPFMPILAPGKKSGDTNSNPLPGTLQRLNELIHMKLLKIWKKKKESKNYYCYNYCYSLTPSLLLVLLPPSPSLSFPLSHPLLFSPSTLRNAIKLLYNTSFLYNAYCKSAEPWQRYNHQRDALTEMEQLTSC